jgi:hypothetical protein
MSAVFIAGAERTVSLTRHFTVSGANNRFFLTLSAAFVVSWNT